MANDRFRTFFITINKGAQCYDSALQILRKKISGEDLFGYIKHDKDIITNEDILNWCYMKDEQMCYIDGEEPVLGSKKTEHIHVAIEFVNAKTFKTLMKLLPGAHIEKPISKIACFQYLTHMNDPEKYQYNKKEVISNNYSKLKLYLDAKDKEPFDPNKILYYILNKKYNLRNILAFYDKFGKQVNHYMKLISTMLDKVKTMTTDELYEYEYKSNYNNEGEVI